MVINGIQVKEGQDNLYTFPSRGNHLINITKCTSLDSLLGDVSNMTSIIFTSEFNTENVENMDIMIFGCTSLVSIKFSNLNTKNVKNMNAMFHRFYSLYSLDFSNLEFKKC